jgi:copper chaperone CopZ
MAWGETPHDGMHHTHEEHVHEKFVDGKKLEVDPERFDKFIMDLKDTQIAIVNVQGMVCDFCARGIEKIFKKDTNVKKIDVDLSKGKVLIAYNVAHEIIFEDIRDKILMNGQNAIDMQVIDL